MDYNDLALFTRVVEQGSFTSAAKATGLPKSSVTRGIARLERELGVRLIQRTTRQRGVTSAGRELYERVRGAVGALEEATEAVREHGQEPAGIVRVTANPDVWMMGVPEALVDLRKKLPKIVVEMILTTRVVDLVAEGVDLGLRAGHLADSTLVARRVGASNLGIFATRAYLKKRGRPQKLADLADHDCIVFRHMRTWKLDGPRGPQEVEVRGIASADEFAFIWGMVKSDAGLALMPLFLAHQLGGVERVLPDYTMLGGPLHIVMPSASYVPARVTAVRDHLFAQLSKTLASCDKMTPK